jgi:DNA-directed RNA polymerase specialized sigma24 family protein
MDRPNLNLIDIDNNEEAFNKLLRRLEPSYTSTDGQYIHFRHKLVKFFAWRRCEDPEGLADETIGRLVKNLNTGQEIHGENAYSYIYAIAVNLFKEFLRKKNKDQQVVENWQPPRAPVAEAVRDCRRLCLQSLSKDKLQLLEKYYLDEESREDLALIQGVSLNALRLQVHRIKNELRTCYQRCLKGSQTARK